MNIPKPSWYKDNQILISNPQTCGINKDGLEQYKVDPLTGERSKTEIDDQLSESVDEILNRNIKNEHTSYIDVEKVKKSKVLVPQYHDKSTLEQIEKAFTANKDYTLKSLGQLVNEGYITLFSGHGSPSSDQRIGDIPYIKVSDIRAGNININPANMIPEELAKKYWKGDKSNLEAYDLLSPERASKNIGEFSVLMPGQENIVLTKEILIIRSLRKEYIDQFYLLWALSLKLVRNQWDRIILMQTNREDVGERVLEILIPFPNSKKVADDSSEPFRTYYQSIEAARKNLNKSLKNAKYETHFRIE
ncbi:hypothetical protein R4Z09_12165 [Niallia oryzisoli]|uniref:Type I restriction modification DNA specificity domain-containing protein n=1 Tax=Niallia oryzisoli TaxID=1737571 RepID=A0ABZ2CJX6_9BACI